jgi:hypothetical protein
VTTRFVQVGSGFGGHEMDASAGEAAELSPIADRLTLQATPKPFGDP